MDQVAQALVDVAVAANAADMRARIAWVGLGSNLGDSAALLRSAACALHQLPKSRLVALSAFYRTPALTADPQDAPQPDYCNAVAAVQTALAAEPLLDALLAIEREHGRIRQAGARWQARVLDLLDYVSPLSADVARAANAFGSGADVVSCSGNASVAAIPLTHASSLAFGSAGNVLVACAPLAEACTEKENTPHGGGAARRRPSSSKRAPLSAARPPARTPPLSNALASPLASPLSIRARSEPARRHDWLDVD